MKDFNDAVADTEKPGWKTVWIYLGGEKLTGVIVPAGVDPVKLTDRWKSILAKYHPDKEVTIKGI